MKLERLLGLSKKRKGEGLTVPSVPNSGQTSAASSALALVEPECQIHQNPPEGKQAVSDIDQGTYSG
jgi:hypothetical protein